MLRNASLFHSQNPIKYAQCQRSPNAWITHRTSKDAQDLAREEFNLSGELVFETTDLLGPDDAPVRIHHRAWEGISAVLRTVTVKLAHAPAPAPVARPRPSEALSGARRLSQKRISVVNNPAPIRHSNGGPAPLNGASERQSFSARKGPMLASSSRPASIVGSHKDLASNLAGPSAAAVASASVRLTNGVNSPPAPALSPAKIEELDDDYEEEQEDARMLSPTKKRAARPRVLSDYGLGGDDADGAQDEDEDQGEDLDQPSPTATQSGRISRAGNASIIELGGPPSGSGARKPNAGKASPARPLDGEFYQCHGSIS